MNVKELYQEMMRHGLDLAYLNVIAVGWKAKGKSKEPLSGKGATAKDTNQAKVSRRFSKIVGPCMEELL